MTRISADSTERPRLILRRAEKRGSSWSFPAWHLWISRVVQAISRLLLLLDFELGLFPGVIAEDQRELVVALGLLNLAFAIAAAEVDFGAVEGQLLRLVDVLPGERALPLFCLAGRHELG